MYSLKSFIYILLVSLFSLGCGATIQQQYASHTVAKGDTAYSVSKEYGITADELYRLNPEAKNGLKENTVLILPAKDLINAGSSSSDITETLTDKFKMHRVKRKETLFGISQQYGVSVDELKKYNKELYSRELKKGEKIRIPIVKKVASYGSGNSNNSGSVSGEGMHTVVAKETKFGIARKYGITMAELESLNPNLPANLPIGIVLNVPKKSVIGSATIEDEAYDFYEVQSKEGFFRLKVKLGLSEEEIVALNPYAKDGLKEGMILKIPKGNSEIIKGSKATKVDLERSITNRSKKNIAVLLPFRLNRAQGDSTEGNENLIKEDGTLRVALDFYSGVLMATEFAKDKGISVNLNVYDTEASDSKVGSIISQNNFDDTHAVIGPLLRKNVERAASDLKRSDVPVFSPLSNRAIKISSNLFQTLPTDEMLEKSMLNYLKQNEAGKNFIVIADGKRRTQKDAVLSVLPQAKNLTPRNEGFLYVNDIASKVVDGQENWVILESQDPVLVSNVVGVLNGMSPKYKLRLFTLDKNDAYDYHDVSNMHLAKLGFTFPSVKRTYDYNKRTAFVTSYKNKYGVLPNRFAVRGFDITYDVLLRLASADDVYDATSSDYETEYVENKFRYSKKLLSGYQNEASYIIKFKDDLQYEVIE
ncbi:LysM peptidoglycan-binding domain-containing protein [Cochleicola gelatinilyticus]|uniref:LysM domain-containing protein n=1 Tax=Cochleicola gelatinilyticus TaxID=1763537 RepID=A0A167K8Y8_9FLAO|nr:LysM peptidoglycan-binding domain-containing protein [Cochleicola gelatinilyticus]OAB81514.1 hypothetical protein ULVI_01465 [Cochleicola gelatinilyticus]